MILVIAEHNNSALNSATRNAVTAATQLGGDVHVLVAGHNCGEVAKQAASIAGVAKVLVSDAAHYAWPLAENIAPLVASLAKNYTHVLAAATTTAKDIMPRAAALCDMSQVSEITLVVSADTFVRPIYAGNALETVQSSDAKKVITVRPTVFKAAAEGGSAPTEAIAAPGAPGKTRFLDQQIVKSARPDLGAAKIVVSGGRAMGSAEEFHKVIEPLADKLGAAVGASRAAVDAGYAPNDYQVGQTGKVVAPELYIAIGISGAIQHLAGMKDSKVIVAINKDGDAPIFQVADFGLVSDYKTAVPDLMSALTAAGK